MVSSIIWIYFLTQSENKTHKNMFSWFLHLLCMVCNLPVSCPFGFWGIQIFQVLGQHHNHCAFFRQKKSQTREGLRPQCDCGDITWFMKRLRHWFLQNLSAGSEKFYQAMALGLCMYVCACAQLCVCVYAPMGMRLGISFANLIKLIMDLVFSLYYIPDLTDKNGVLRDLVKVFQSRRANIPGHHNWSSGGQVQNVTHLVPLAVKNLNANSFRWEFQGLECPCSAKSFMGPLKDTQLLLLCLPWKTDQGGSRGRQLSMLFNC